MTELHQELTEGEAWTRGQLGLLLGARFSPPAIARFVAASQRRANAVRAERPELGRQSRRWLTAGAAAYLPLARRVRVRDAAAWWAATAIMLDWHLGMFETPEGAPRPLSPADACTLARAWLVPVVAADPAPATCALGALTDVLDGRLARAGEPTRAGRDLEGLVDFCFAVAALRGLVREGKLSRGVVGAEVARTSAGFAYALIVYFGRAARPDDDLLHHARATTSVRVAGLVAAAAGRRRLGDTLVAAGCAWSLAELSRAARSPASSLAPAASP